MKVILNADVANLGEEGDIVDVAPGYARNYLLPKKLVVLHNAQNLAALESRKAAIEKKREAKRQAAASDKEKISTTTLALQMPAGEHGKLFGSVTNATIADELAKLGINIEKKKIEIPGHVLKQTGEYKLHVKLYGNESAELKVQIQAMSEAERKA
jgi:large subunit ribosomal protein L9